MNRQTRSTWRSKGLGLIRHAVFAESVAALVGATAVAGCSDDPKASPTFAQPTDTTSSTATNTTASTQVVTPTTPPVTPPPPPVTPPVPPVTPTTPGSTTTTPTTTDTTSVSTDSVVATEVSSDSLASTVSEASTTAPIDSNTLVLPTGEVGDAGTDTAVSESSDAPSSGADTAQPGLDASVTEDAAVEETSDVPSDTSAATADTTSAVATSDVSSSADTSSDSVQNLITNPGFEAGAITGWAEFGAGTLTASTAQHNSGSYAGYSSGRTDTWNGPSVDLLNTADTGETYHAEAWVRLTASDNVQLTFAVICEGAADYYSTQTVAATANTWTHLTGDVAIPLCAGTVTQLTFYVEGPGTTTNIYVDDAIVYQLP